VIKRYRVDRVALTLRGFDGVEAGRVVAGLRGELARELREAGSRLGAPARPARLRRLDLRVAAPTADPSGRDTARGVGRAIGEAISSAATRREGGG
jgi:hypothetical protein